MGEAKKRRLCPAVAREITPAECGENRHSRYACPESCTHNPFAVAAYSELLEIEDRLDLTAMKRLAAEDAAATEAILAARRDGRDLGMSAAAHWQLFFRPGSDGRTFAGRWTQSSPSDLRNDERVLWRGKMQMRVALLEVHRVLEAPRVEVVDLLDVGGAPFVIVDRSFAAVATRFHTVLACVYPLPHFWRLSGTAISLGDLGPWPAAEVVEACLTHLGGPSDAPARRLWLAENFSRLREAFSAVALERRRLMFAGLDGTWGASTYGLRGSLTKALRLLRAEPGIVAEEVSGEERKKGFTQAFVWIEGRPAGASTTSEATFAEVVLGRVLVGKKEFRLEAMGKARLRDFRARFEARMGSAVEFSRERLDDHAGRLAAADPPADVALVPPRLLEKVNELQLSTSRAPLPPPGVSAAEHGTWLQREHLRTWRDEPVPALAGRTPREAVRDPALRPWVVEFVKRRVREIDEGNLQHGRSDDANELIRDLGLSEIDFPPPPPRPVPLSYSDDDFDSADDDFDFDPPGGGGAEAECGRPPAPRLLGPPLTSEAAIDRVETIMREFDLAADALNELAASGATIVEDLADMTVEMFKPREFDFLVTILIQAWFALVPVGVRAPRIDLDALADEIDAVNARLTGGGDVAEETLAKLTETGRQPELVKVLMTQLLVGSDRLPKKMRLSADAKIASLVVLRSVVDELDRALRRA
jgi:hypothetical protein